YPWRRRARRRRSRVFSSHVFLFRLFESPRITKAPERSLTPSSFALTAGPQPPLSPRVPRFKPVSRRARSGLPLSLCPFFSCFAPCIRRFEQLEFCRPEAKEMPPMRNLDGKRTLSLVALAAVLLLGPFPVFADDGLPNPPPVKTGTEGKIEDVT